VSINKTLPLTDEELEVFEASRDLGTELLQAGREMRAGLGRIVYSPLIAARKNAGLTQQQFAEFLGISAETLESWEQLREQPTEEAQTLITLVLTDPKAVSIPQT
jgi:putative transcriptional regulator